MKIQYTILASAILFFVQNAAVSGAESPRFEIDPSIAIDKLVESGAVHVTTEKDGQFFRADASAVLKTSLDRITAVAADYDHYVQFKLPNLYVSEIVERVDNDDENASYTYTEICLANLKPWVCKAAGAYSRHFLRIDHVVLPGQTGEKGATGSYWSLIDKKPEWPHEDGRQFNVLDGSWYAEALDPALYGEKRVYVRYFIASDPAIPSIYTSVSNAEEQFAEGVQDVIKALAAAAKRGH